MNMSRAFAVRIDAAKLSEGVHSATIRAYDVNNVEKGPVFRIPVTVVQPMTLPKTANLPDFHYTNMPFKPNTINRHFILVPDDATWAGNTFFFSLYDFPSANSKKISINHFCT